MRWQNNYIVLLCAMFSISVQPFSLMALSKSRLKSDRSNIIDVYINTTSGIFSYNVSHIFALFFFQALIPLLKLGQL